MSYDKLLVIWQSNLAILLKIRLVVSFSYSANTSSIAEVTFNSDRMDYHINFHEIIFSYMYKIS